MNIADSYYFSCKNWTVDDVHKLEKILLLLGYTSYSGSFYSIRNNNIKKHFIRVGVKDKNYGCQVFDYSVYSYSSIGQHLKIKYEPNENKGLLKFTIKKMEYKR